MSEFHSCVHAANFDDHGDDADDDDNNNDADDDDTNNDVDDDDGNDYLIIVILIMMIW